MPPIQEIQAVKQQHEKRVSLALSVLSDGVDDWNGSNLINNPNNSNNNNGYHDYGDTNDFNTSLNPNDFNSSQHSLNLRQSIRQSLRQPNPNHHEDYHNLRADYDAAIKCIHLCETLIDQLQTQTTQQEQTIHKKDGQIHYLQEQTRQLMHSLQMAEQEREDELERANQEKEEYSQRLIEMSLELARVKSFEDQYYLVKRKLEEVENERGSDGDVDGGENCHHADKNKNKKKRTDDDDDHDDGSISKEETPADSFSMGFGWQHHQDEDDDESQAVVSIEPYNKSVRRLSSSSLVSIPQQQQQVKEEESINKHPNKNNPAKHAPAESSTQTFSNTISNIDDHTFSNIISNMDDNNNSSPSPRVSTIWNQVEAFTKSRSKLSSAAESALFGSFASSSNSSKNKSSKNDAAHKASQSFGFGWPEKDDEEEEVSVIAPTVPSTAISSSFVSSISNVSDRGPNNSRDERSRSNSSTIGRMASNITTSSGTFVKSVASDFLANLKEETIR